jgi:hypothetical protein
MNRREILRTGSLSTLGLLGSQTFSSARAQARVAGSNERIRIGIVGFSDRILQVGSQRRSGQTYMAACAYLKSGKFGPIVAAEMTWNVNQPGRWRRPDLVAAIKEQDTDWKRFLCNRPDDQWDPRKYLEFRLFWPYSSGITGQWMCHQIDTIHWFTGLPHPRSVSANGGIYQWKDGRTNFDTLTAVFDYGPLSPLRTCTTGSIASARASSRMPRSRRAISIRSRPSWPTPRPAPANVSPSMRKPRKSWLAARYSISETIRMIPA